MGYTTWESGLRGMDTPTLLEQADLVADLEQQPGWAVIKRVIERKQAQDVGLLIHGPVHDDALHYASVVKFVRGLGAAVHVAEAIRYAAQERERQEREKNDGGA